MTASWRPDWAVQLAFNSSPNDPGAVPVWADQTAMVTAAGAITRGQQYELDQSQAAQPQVTFRDPNEYLNPANTSSPYYPYVQPYRQLLWQGMWPNGGTGNVLNAGTWRVPYDGSFDSYSIGSTPPWITAVGATTPIVGTTTPHSGANDLTWAVANGTAVQGVSWQVPCIPGRQYTSSVYVRQSSASTQSIRVTDQTSLVDLFNRTTANGWGNAQFLGGAWTVSGGASSDYSTAPGSGVTPGDGFGYHSVGAVGSSRKTVAGSLVDSDQRVLITIPAAATGGEITFGLIARFTNANNYYFGELAFQTDGTVSVRVQKVVAGTTTTIGTTVATGFHYTAGSMVWLRVQNTGPSLRIRAWLYGTSQPTTWTVDQTDTALTAAGSIGARSRLDAANTNSLPVVATFQAYTCTGSVTGTTTSATGAYNRVSVTWTATQPLHTIQLATSGTAVAGTVLADDVQHEPGGSASAFTTSGPVIYPLMGNYVERWPRVWSDTSAGFEGFCVAPCVDGFAALNALGIPTEYPAAVLALNPDYYWRLNDGTDTSFFLDTSGNLGPPLTYVTRFTTSNFPQPGSDMGIVGDPGGTGVLFTRPTGSIQHVDLGIGPTLVPGSPPVNLPASVGTGWSVTASCWAVLALSTGFGDGANLFEATTFVSNVFTATVFMVAGDGSVFGSELAYVGTANSLTATGPATNYLDLSPHHYCGVVTQDSTNTTVTLYIDGAQVATATASTSSLGGLTTPSNSLAVGDDANGILGHVAVWNRALSSAEIAALYQAGAVAFAGETSGARITRHLAIGGYTGASRVNAGTSTMEAPTYNGGINLLTDSQDTTTAEQGRLWIAPDGALVFEGRQQRWLRLTSSYTLGENSAGGESPYLGDLEFDYDPNYVFADVRVSRNDGATALGGTVNDITTAVARYFPRQYTADVDVETDDLAQDMANWIFNTHKSPSQRVSAITLDPVSNPDLWPVVLSVEIGTRVTVIRRPKAANAGAGITMTGDYFVESVSHDNIDFEACTHQVTLLLSPIGQAPGITMQPWILDDTTLSVLGSTTVLGF